MSLVESAVGSYSPKVQEMQAQGDAGFSPSRSSQIPSGVAES